jgi:hypothetical protein
MGASRRQLLVGGVAAATAAAVASEEVSVKEARLDGIAISDEELDVAKDAMAIFIGSFPAGANPEPDQVAEKGRVAIRAMRALKKG